MKKYKKQHFILFLLIAFTKLFGQIIGPNELTIGVSANYGVANAPFWATNFQWSVNSTNCTITGATSSAITLTPKLQEQNCTVTLTLTYQYYDNVDEMLYHASETKNITIAPSIIAPDMNIYVGQTTTFHVQDNCPHTNCTYNWNIVPAGLCAAPCNASGSTFLVTCPASGFPPGWTLNCTMVCNNFPSAALTQRSGLIKLGPIGAISGPGDIGCVIGAPSASYPVMYSVPAVPGAASYNWTLPGYMSLAWTSGSGNTILVNVNATGTGGVIKVQALDGNAPPTKSDFALKTVDVCCVPYIPVTVNIAAPAIDQRQAGIMISANNTIGSGASAMYHAGSQVELTPGFSAEPGSYFHGYIRSCDGTYNRMAYDDGSNSNLADEGVKAESQNIETTNTSRSSEPGVSVFPNPNQGSFTVSFNRLLTGTLVITDELGITVYETSINEKQKIELGITGLQKGIYFLKIVVSQRNIKPTKLVIE